jgi:hypothetical protein
LVLSCWSIAGGARAQNHSIDLPNTNAASFGYVTIPGSSQLAPTTLTIEATITPTGDGYGNTTDAFGAWIIGKSVPNALGSSPFDFVLRWSPVTSQINISLMDQSGSVGHLSSTTLVEVNTTAHVAATWDGSTIRLFVNGEPAGIANPSIGTLRSSADELRIGAAEASSGFLRRFKGLVDDVRIWSIARSATEIASTMRCQPTGPTANLRAAWVFDGSSLVDVAGGGHHGTAVGNMTFVSSAPTACTTTGVRFCIGDGSASACPCGNEATPGTQTGCTSSLGYGALLSASGTANIATDTLTLFGLQLTNSSCLFFQGTTGANGGLGTMFGDGLRCASGTIVRLGTKTASAGGAQYPGAGDVSISLRGGVSVPGNRYYQSWYRNAAIFCSPDTFNLTNGLEIAWTP